MRALNLALVMAAAVGTSAAHTSAGGLTPPVAPTIFEISTRPWLFSLSQKYGHNVTLGSVPQAEWQAIAATGAQVVWLMGVWELGAFGLNHDRTDPSLISTYNAVLPGWQIPDVIGSPYAIVSYTVNPAVGTADDLTAVRALLNSWGISLMLDFVPNHTAVDGEWATSNPSYFVNAPTTIPFDPSMYIKVGSATLAYGRDPYDAPWTDTIQLNYWNPDTRKTMTTALMAIAAVADMARCDMAMLMLNDEIANLWGAVMAANGYARPATEFWSDALTTVRSSYPAFKVMAEAYNYGITPQPEDVTLQGLGIDYTYNKNVLDLLVANNLDNLRQYISSQSQTFFSRTVHFVENHDEPRSAAALGGEMQAFAGAVVASTLPGARLYYMGEFEGFKNRLDVHLRRAVPEPSNSSLEGLYAKLLSVVDDDVFKTGTWTYIPLDKSGTGWRLVAWRWAGSSSGAGSDSVTGSHRACVINFSDTQGWANVVLPDATGDGGGDNITLLEMLTDVSYVRSASALRTTGLVVGVDPWSAQLFRY